MSFRVTPYKNSSLGKKDQVAAMFNNISPRYDFLNHFLSLGVDRFWRRAAIRSLSFSRPALILDVATGTADLAIEAMRLSPKKIVGVDISGDMIALAKRKIKKKKLTDSIELLEADSENLFFDDNKFDAITVGFGVRNFETLEKGLAEMHRVLKPGGSAVILEFSHPHNRFIRSCYNFYSQRICPAIGKAVSKDQAAYSYLHESISAFPEGKEFEEILVSCGFRDIKMKPLTFGVVTIYTGKK